jgi:hypothetical protein
MNAVKHGRYARSFYVLRHEDHAEFEAFTERFIRRLLPTDDLEIHLVRQLAFAEWRLLRISRMDSSVFDHEFISKKTALSSAGHDTAAATTLSVAANSLLENTRLPAYLAQREIQLLRVRNSVLRALRQLRSNSFILAVPPQLTEPMDVKPENEARNELPEETQVIDAEPLPGKPFQDPLP